MAKFKVLNKYKDLELDRELEPEEEVEMTVKRAKEVEKKLAEQVPNKTFLERLD
ncbi:hypothetical protein [Aerococcus kribbianus]|uniref:Uncharacterized protein n=1 Tax=Aerococcus kribbianus TaxID=2999064 RepID=A0A9X3FP19_9LACT|nr:MULTISPECIES: hypothetical protein [unclassified Aerococcus]MCZ0717835.1 hypothetical protein [Aerococcus sp. YH-aer221]MCZ0726122.1 hypothetical protein [Aerococcus sp. YH-aer222]